MNSRVLWLGLALASGAVRAAPPAFVAAQFAAPPEPASVELRGPRADAAAALLGEAYPRPLIPYWRAGDRTVWILEGRARSGRFTAGFVLERNRIARCEVLEYRGHRGREIQSTRFLRQFEGAGLDATRELDRSVEGVTGATLSVNALQNLARLALYLERETNPAPP
jgi:hypothetical protein